MILKLALLGDRLVRYPDQQVGDVARRAAA